MPSNVGAYGIGSDHFPGMSKLLEEMGELQQVLGKIMGSNGLDHWDGDLEGVLLDEISDVMAAIGFFVVQNGLQRGYLMARAEEKKKLFTLWHEEGR